MSGRGRYYMKNYTSRWRMKSSGFAIGVLAALFAVSGPAQAGPAREEKGQLFDGPGGKLYYAVMGSGNETPLVLVNGRSRFDPTSFHTSTPWDALAKNPPVSFYQQRRK